jgi:DNA-damage-inducible protein J
MPHNNSVLKGGIFMVQAMVNFRLDENIKKNMEQACKEMGMSMTTAFTIFATKVGEEKRMPFEIAADPFYSESNMNYLRRVISDIETGNAVLTEHELIEE